MASGLNTVAAAVLSIGVFCLIPWLPLPIQQIVLVHASPGKSRADFLFGTIGTISYVAQAVRLMIVGIELPPHFSWIAASLVAGAVLVALLLFGVCVLNFLRTAIDRTAAR
jgi:hypothetical protein